MDPFYSDLAHLFSIEAFDVDAHGKHVEADRLWEIAEELHEKALESRREKAVAPR